MDGLVLVWIASRKSPYVHCLDITLVCRAHAFEGEDAAAAAAAAAAANRNDGWRGYFQNNKSDNEQGIVDIAACRMPMKQGHGTIICGLLDGD